MAIACGLLADNVNKIYLCQTDTKEREALMRVKDVAAILGQHPATVYRKIAAGELPSVRLGSGQQAAIRIPRASLARWLLYRTSQGRRGVTSPIAGSPRGGLEGEAA
jgi:excisionase family DNA binding protein